MDSNVLEVSDQEVEQETNESSSKGWNIEATALISLAGKRSMEIPGIVSKQDFSLGLGLGVRGIFYFYSPVPNLFVGGALEIASQIGFNSTLDLIDAQGIKYGEIRYLASFIFDIGGVVYYTFPNLPLRIGGGILPGFDISYIDVYDAIGGGAQSAIGFDMLIFGFGDYSFETSLPFLIVTGAEISLRVGSNSHLKHAHPVIGIRGGILY